MAFDVAIANIALDKGSPLLPYVVTITHHGIIRSSLSVIGKSLSLARSRATYANRSRPRTTAGLNPLFM